MQENALFWDKNINKEEFKKVLKNESDPKFIEFASILFSRTNDPKSVFNNYLDKVSFCKNWPRIKRKMRQNKWSDNRVIFWNEFYKVIMQGMDKSKLKDSKIKPATIPEIKQIGEKIKNVRKQKGWTQKVLAEKTKVSQQTISFIEQGHINVSFMTLKKVTNILGLGIYIEDKTGHSSNMPNFTVTSISTP